MAESVTRTLIAEHLISGELKVGSEIGLRIDQTLTQDATGTLVMLELAAMDLDRVRTEVSVQYVDHNLVQADHRNPDDHLFLRSACRRFGIWFSPAGNGVSHPVHMEHFGRPGATLLGSDSHTPAAGALGMLAIGAGGIEVAAAMAGEPFWCAMPAVWGVELVGSLRPGVSAKDVILEMLRRHGVAGGLGRVIEYHGPGLACFGAMDRHVIANMGAELGATSSVFPSDEEVRRFLRRQGREDCWRSLQADAGATYDHAEVIDLSQVEPLIAMPSSPGKVRPVREVEGIRIHQAYLGSSANPGYRDFAVAANLVAGRRVPDQVSFDINPASRRILLDLVRDGHLATLIAAGARVHQTGCNGCIGMGQAPATGRLSLRTVPRNFPGRSGTRDDQVCLVSPETATASALAGAITDPRPVVAGLPPVREPGAERDAVEFLSPPLPEAEARRVELEKGPNIGELPRLPALPGHLEVPVLLSVGDDISTDEIMPAGAKVLPFRSNIPAISRFVFERIDPAYPDQAKAILSGGGSGHAIVAGRNYGQGSSREHAALAPRFLGLRVVLARSFARIHHQNLVNFGVLPLTLPEDAPHRFQVGTVLRIDDPIGQVGGGRHVEVVRDDGRCLHCRHDLSHRMIGIIGAGGLINRIGMRTRSG